jgi:glycosyltransferase involved in cell wall biosynthesis
VQTFEPLISVITPTFNHEHFIGSCIESLINQTYSNWEQIVIDDGSTDKTATLISQYKDSRIHYHYQQNRGIEALAHTYNNALSKTQGQFIAILEGDDLWPPEKLSQLVPHFIDEGVVLAYGAVAEISADGKWAGRLGRAIRHRRNLSRSILLNDPPGAASTYMLRADGADLIPPSTVIIRKSALDFLGGFQYVPDLCVTDFPTFIALTLKGKFYYTPEVVGYRRRHLGSATFQNQNAISVGVRRYQEEFIKRHGLQITNRESRMIAKTWQASECDAAFVAGRICLLKKRWSEARNYFTRATDPRFPRLFIASLVGWLLSWVHVDLESLFELIGIASLRQDFKKS